MKNKEKAVEQSADMAAKPNKLVSFPMEDLGYENAPGSKVIFGACDWQLTVGDVRNAIAASRRTAPVSAVQADTLADAKREWEADQSNALACAVAELEAVEKERDALKTRLSASAVQAVQVATDEKVARAEFEDWAQPRGYSMERTTDSYKSQGTKSAWRGWWACARRAAPVSPQAVQVATCSHVWNDFGQLGGRNVSWCPRCDTLAWTGKEPAAPVSPPDGAMPEQAEKVLPEGFTLAPVQMPEKMRVYLQERMHSPICKAEAVWKHLLKMGLDMEDE